jgi:serine O-acetyltransferase
MRKADETIAAALTTRSSDEPTLWQYIAEDRRLNGLLRPGFHALLMYRVGRWAQQRPLKRWIFLRLAATLRFFIRNVYGIELYWSSEIGRRLYIAHQGTIALHPNCTVGDDCVIRQGCTIGASEERLPEEEAPILGNNVQVGAGAMVLGKIRIGNNVRIGPNAVVTTDVPDNSTVMAPPSRIITWGPQDADEGIGARTQ